MSQRVLIIGGGGGIGSAVARLVTAAGGHVFLAGRDATKLQAVASELGAAYATVDASDFDAAG